MYICMCNGFRESEVREAAREGARDADEAYKNLGGIPCCRRCIPTAEALVAEERGGQVRAADDQGRRTGFPLPAACPA